MKCVICKKGETQPGKATVTLDRNDMILVFKGVPANVCQNCGEQYIDEQTTTTLLKKAEEAAQAGVQVDIRQYLVA